MEKMYAQPHPDEVLASFEGIFPDFVLRGSDGGTAPDSFHVSGVPLSPFEATSMPTAEITLPAEVDACDITTKDSCPADCDPDK